MNKSLRSYVNPVHIVPALLYYVLQQSRTRLILLFSNFGRMDQLFLRINTILCLQVARAANRAITTWRKMSKMFLIGQGERAETGSMEDGKVQVTGSSTSACFDAPLHNDD